MKTNRSQKRAGRYKQLAEVWTFGNYSQNPTTGEPIYHWKLKEKLRCFIDESAGREYFAGDYVEDKENFYLEFRFVDVGIHDQIRFIDKWKRQISLTLVAIYDDEEQGRFIRAVAYALAPTEMNGNPNSFKTLMRGNQLTTGDKTTGGTKPVKPIHVIGNDLPHVISSTLLLSNHKQIDIIFDKPIFFADGDGHSITETISFHIGSKLINPTKIIIDPSNDRRLIIDIPTAIRFGDVVTWSYIDTVLSTNIFAKKKDGTDAKLENQTFGVTNGIVQGVHTLDITSANVDASGTSITLTFDSDILPASKLINSGVLVNGKNVHIGTPYTGKDYVLISIPKIYKGDTVVVHFTGATGIFDKLNPSIEWKPNPPSFSAVNNSNILPPVIVTPDLVYESGHAINAIDYDMIFDSPIKSVDLKNIFLKVTGTFEGRPLDSDENPLTYSIAGRKITFTTPSGSNGHGYWDGSNVGYIHIKDPNAIISTNNKGLVVGTHYDIKN